MFERAYALRSLTWQFREELDARINDTVTEFDRPNAAASIACMTTDADYVHILIEYWRVTDAPETVDRSREGQLDPTPAKRRPRRSRASAADDVRAAERVEQEVVSEPVGAAGRTGSHVSADDRQSAGEAPRRLKEEDVPLPFDYHWNNCPKLTDDTKPCHCVIPLHGISEAIGTCEEFPLTTRSPYLGISREQAPTVSQHPFTCGIHRSNLPVDCTCGKRTGRDKKSDPGVVQPEPEIEWP